MKRFLDLFGIGHMPAYIRHRLDLENIQLAIPMALFTMIASIVFLHSIQNYQMSIFAIRLQRLIYSFLLLGSVSYEIVALINLSQKRINHKQVNTFLYIYIIACLTFGIGNSILRYSMGDHMMSFIIMTIWAFFFFHLQPWKMIVLISIEFTTMYYLLVREGLGYYHTYGILLLWAVIIMACILRYRLDINNVKVNQKSKKTNRKLERSNSQLQKISKLDALTSVQNRYALNHNFKTYIHKNIVVAMADLDHFKTYNDSYGHDIGDHVLKYFSHILEKNFGKEDCYRYGGDEFLIVSYMEPDTFYKTALKTSNQFEEVMVEDEPIDVSFSMGYVYGYVHNLETLRAMLKKADIELYDIKKKGRNEIHGKPLQEASL